MDVELRWQPGDSSASWVNGGVRIVKDHQEALQSAVYLDDPPSIVLVESISRSGPRNAVVYELDGTERTRLHPPLLPDPLGFDQVFKSSAGVEAVFITRRGDFHGTPDLVTGDIRNVHDWR